MSDTCNAAPDHGPERGKVHYVGGAFQLVDVTIDNCSGGGRNYVERVGGIKMDIALNHYAFDMQNVESVTIENGYLTVRLKAE